MQNNNNNVNAAEIRAAADALANLATLGSDHQYVPANQDAGVSNTIILGADRKVIKSLFTPGRLRGTMHYEATYATMAEDNLARFLKAINADPVRAEAVRSVKLDLICDNLLNSGLVDLLNETLPTYAFTDDASGGPYPPLTEAALLMKAYQRKMTSEPQLANHPLRPTNFGRLSKIWLSCASFKAHLLEIHLNLIIRLCPKVSVIQVPERWCETPNLPLTEATQKKWKDDHGWEVEVKEVVSGDFVRIGKKGGWSSDHIKRWLDVEVAGDIARNG